MRIIITLSLLCIAGMIQAQISFFNKYAGTSFDRGEGATQLPDSSYLITGSSTTFLEASSQAFLMKIDSTGNRLWTKSYGGNETDRGRRVFYVPNDGIYVVGQSSSFTGNFYDAWWFKTDVNGNLVSEAHFGGLDYENIHDAVMLPDASIVLVGESYSNDGQAPDIYMLRISSAGILLWENRIGTTAQTDLAYGLTLYDNNTVIVCGKSYNTSTGINQAFLTRMLTDGTVQWTRYYGFTDDQAFHDVHVYRDTIRAGGYFTKTNGTERGYYALIADMNGNTLREDMADLQGDYEIKNVQRFQDNKYVLSMMIKNAPAIPTFSTGYDHIFYQFNNQLYFDFKALNFSEPDDDLVNDVIRTSDNGFLAVGYRSWNDEVQLTVLKVDGRHSMDATNVPQNNLQFVQLSELPADEFSIYPNPASGVMTIQGKSQMEQLIMWDMSGRLVQETYPATSFAQMDFSAYPPGIYLLELHTNSGVWNGKIQISH